MRSDLSISYRELTGLFLKLGLIAFGGPVAHIAMMQKEVVEDRGWLTHKAFMDALSITHLIPGPNSTEMAMHIGFLCKRWRGLFLAGAAFILPATLLSGFLGYLFFKYSTLPVVQPFLMGIKPAILGLIAVSVWTFSKKTCTSIFSACIGIVALLICVFTPFDLWVLFGAAFIVPILRRLKITKGLLALVLTLLPTTIFASSVQYDASGITGWDLFKVFFKIGAILFGSGFVLIAYLDTELIQTLQWLSPEMLLDAVALGQITPGPVLSTATIIGAWLYGVKGAVIATVGIFLPSFLIVALIAPFYEKISKNRLVGDALLGVNASVVGIMGGVLVHQSIMVVNSWQMAVFAVCAAAYLQFVPRANTVLLIVVSAILGAFLI